MSSGKKVGRKSRRLSPGEKLLIQEFRDQLSKKLKAIGQEALCKKLKICKASLYNYINEEKWVFPGNELLKRAHDTFEFTFHYLDFPSEARGKRQVGEMFEHQGVLPFLELLRKDDIEVVDKKTVKGETTLELTVQIRFKN